MRIVVEGESDVGVAERLVTAAGHTLSAPVTVTGGKTKLDPRIANYSRAARLEPWVVLRDSDNTCPVELRTSLLSGFDQEPLFALRIAHTMTEAWLMADRDGFASYFKVSVRKIPLAPEDEDHAKHTLLRLALGSRSSAIRAEVARNGTKPGQLFVHHLNTFARQHWDVEAAAQNSASLRRAVAALRAIPPSPEMEQP